MYDPGSPVYKKARKLHLKTTKNRPVDIEDGWTPFRVMEKKFKAKWPPPDLSDVLDLSVAYDDTDMDKEGTGSKRSWGGQANAVEWREIGLDVEECVEDERGKRRAYVFPSVPGLVYLPAFIPPSEQRTLVYWSLKEHAKPPNETNLDAHYVLPLQGLWSAFIEARAANDLASESVLPKPSAPSGPSSDSGPRALITNPPASLDTLPELLSLPTPPPTPSPHAKPASPAYLIPKLRWANIGWHYHWGNKQYDFSRGAGGGVADVYRRVCMRAVRGVRWDEVYHGLDSEETGWRTWKEEYEPDAGIVNFYQTKDTLMAHVDRSELCATSPLVSISLGCAAVFLIGGPTRDTKPMPVLVRSGDVLIMSGPCRRAYHGVPRIFEGTCPTYLADPSAYTLGRDEAEDWQPYAEYLHGARINVNVRQVFPRGFDPALQEGLEKLYISD